MQFVLAFGVVSMFADMVYESARAITGPYLATLGASAAVVGFVTGSGEAVALVFRLLTGRISDRTGRRWALSIAGYTITVIAVPLIAVTQALWSAAVLVIAERFGKAVRAPANDTMLAQAGTHTGRGKAFALHEALDQSGALLGPLLVAAMVAISGYRLGFAVLAVPGALALLTLAWLRSAVPQPIHYEAYEGRLPEAGKPAGAGRLPGRFWLYAAFTATSMAGFATFGVLSYHMQVRHVLPNDLIPVAYAVAMGAAALAALGSGHVYDRFGLRGLLVAPPLSAVVPLLSFSTLPVQVWAGAIVWGAAVGIHESTLRAAVADLVPTARRGVGYGTFTAVYGLAWLAGSTVIGMLYGYSITAVIVFVVASQAVAVALFLPLFTGHNRSAAR